MNCSLHLTARWSEIPGSDTSEVLAKISPHLVITRSSVYGQQYVYCKIHSGSDEMTEAKGRAVLSPVSFTLKMVGQKRPSY